MSKPVMVVLSGGQDSTTCLFWAKQKFEKVHAVTFDYGQRHSMEIEAAKAVAKLASVESHEVIELGSILIGDSPLVNKAEKVGTYGSVAELPGGVEPTFIPGRNPLFLTIAANRAMCIKADTLVTGICEVDYGGYFDCRLGFLIAMRVMLSHALYGRPLGLHIEAPLLDRSKKETVAMAAGLPGCLEALAYSHTCYQGTFPPCRSCHACLIRLKGFQEFGITDPLLDRASKL